MDEVNGMTRCIEVSFQGMKFAMEASNSAIDLLSRLFKIVLNSVKSLGKTLNPRSEKNIARKLAKETGKTTMELMKMKGQFMFGRMDAETFKELKKQAKKYGIQYAMAPTLEDGVTRIAVRDLDIAAFELFLKDYEKSHFKTQEEISDFRRNNGMDSPMEYMQKSKLATCTTPEYREAMEKVYGKEWDREPPVIQTMDAEKKREVFGAIRENEIKKAQEDGKHLVVTFDSASIFQENDLTVSFSKGSFDEGEMVHMTVDKEDLRYLEVEGEDMFVALIPEEKNIDMVRFADTITKGRVKVSDYIKDPVNSIANAENGQEMAAITISKEIVKDQSETSVTTRVPGTFGKNAKYWTLSLNDVSETHGGKSYSTYIDLKSSYTLHSDDGSVFKITGRELKGHYDDVAVAQKNKKAVFKKRSQEQRHSAGSKDASAKKK